MRAFLWNDCSREKEANVSGSIHILSNLTEILHLLPRPPLFQVWSLISVCDWASQSLCNHCMWLESVPEPMYVSVSGVYVIEEYEILHLLPQPPLSQIWSLYVCVWLGVSVYVWSLYVACVCAWTYVCVLCVCDRRGCNIWIIHCWSKEF